MGLQVCLVLVEAKLLSYEVPLYLYSPFIHVQDPRYVFRRFSLANEGNNLQLAWGKLETLYALQKGSDKLGEVRFDNSNRHFLDLVEGALLQFLDVGHHELLDIGQKPFFEIFSVFIPVFQ